MRSCPLFLYFFILFSTSVLSQVQNVMPNQLLVQLNQGYEINALLEKVKTLDVNLSLETERLIPEMDIWLIKYSGQAHLDVLLEYISALPAVQTAQYNHKVHLRSPGPNSTLPNDPLFNNQWQYVKTVTNPGTAGVDLDADLAWDITTGGITAANDTIVVAVLDNGISPSQTDFGDNLWVNRAEIPNNHIDDDNNGYEDDYKGWNSTSNSDLIAGGGHGTSVAGIIGAKGDNGVGVTGVNWNVKLMIIRNDWSVSEANVLSAYGYALTQRKIYNQSNGQKGAYVVATNASWGLNNGQPANAPLWCAFYDTLGAYGILNMAATANSNVDVDLVGDLPTTCPSDYLVAVTNVNNLGYKETAAAYGSTHIDLGSFGSATYTTVSPSGFGYFGGTSGASPHVAGAVALLYSGACNNFITLSRIYPDSAALLIKKYLLDGVVNIVDLNSTTVSGGYLNLFNSLNLCINDCPDACFGPYDFFTSDLSDTQAQINWSFAPAINQTSYRIKEQGGTWSNFSTLMLNQDSLIVNNLLACTFYDIQFVPTCSSGTDTVTFTFKTDGCCEAPSGLTYSSVKEDSVFVSWNSLLASSSYILSYGNTTSWLDVLSTSNSVWLTNLDSCTYYSVYLKAVCQSGDTTGFTDTVNFVTTGCTDCSLLSYCSAQGVNTNDDWIDTFSVDDVIYASGNNNGYIIFDTVKILLGKGDYHNFSISQGKTFVEFVEIWLDINQDGDFDDPEENISSEIMASTDKTINSSFIVPASSLDGVTRMRVAMQYNSRPNNCGSFTYGEVEDYCVQVIPGNGVRSIQNDLYDISIFPNPFTDEINLSMHLVSDTDIQLSVFSITGQLSYSQTLLNCISGKNSFVIKPELAKGVYLLQIIGNKGQTSRKIIKIN